MAENNDEEETPSGGYHQSEQSTETTPDPGGFLGTLEDVITEADIASAQAKNEELARARMERSGSTGFVTDYYGTSRHLRARSEARRRRDAGLEDQGLFEYAKRLYEIGEGTRKTAGQIEAERKLKILGQTQKGMAQAYGGFDAGALLERGSRGAQRPELTGEAQISEAARQARLAAKSQLEQLLIQSRQRAQDKAFAMQQLAFQEEQASGNLWSNVLSGILGAVGAIGGAFIGQPVAGAAAGAAVGSAAGRWAA